tara:strand:+ start:642 stop:983 length:342 start_codon:yes stop_codon:yes gene_type:complete
MNQHKYTLTEKPCLECGKMHRRKKFCSPYCGSKYNANYMRTAMGVDDPQFASSNINAIIKGSNKEPVHDNSYNFVFSTNIEDWIGSRVRRKRLRYDAKRKAKRIKENGKDTKN